MRRFSIPDLELRQQLAARGLQCHLLAAEKGRHLEFPGHLCKAVEAVVEGAYCLPLSPARGRRSTLRRAVAYISEKYMRPERPMPVAARVRAVRGRLAGSFDPACRAACLAVPAHAAQAAQQLSSKPYSP